MTITMARYDKTSEKTLATLVCGANRLELRLVTHRGVSVTSTWHRLYWNGKQAADSHQLDGAGQLLLGLPADPADRENLLIRPAPEAVDSLTVSSWVAYVDPAKISRADFEEMASCFSSQQDHFNRQIDEHVSEPAADASAERSADVAAGLAIDALFTPKHITHIVYANKKDFEPRVYTWQSPIGLSFEMSILPNGQVALRHSTNHVEQTGRVDFRGERRLLLWQYPRENFLLGRDLAKFTNADGQLLGDRYTLQRGEDAGELFFREGPATIETIYVPTAPPREGVSFAYGRRIDKTYGTSY